MVVIDDINIGTTIVSTDDEEVIHSLSFYPNPAQDLVHLNFTLIKPSELEIEIYDLTGKHLKTISNSMYTGGMNHVDIDTGNLQNGAYIVKLNSREFSKTLKLIIGR